MAPSGPSRPGFPERPLSQTGRTAVSEFVSRAEEIIGVLTVAVRRRAGMATSTCRKSRCPPSPLPNPVPVGSGCRSSPALPTERATLVEHKAYPNELASVGYRSHGRQRCPPQAMKRSANSFGRGTSPPSTRYLASGDHASRVTSCVKRRSSSCSR